MRAKVGALKKWTYNFMVLEVNVQNEFRGVSGEAVRVAASLWRLERRGVSCLP